MKALEIVPEAETGTERAKEIVSTLKRAGYKMLGSGADATVWTKDAGTVIKIIMPEEGETITAAAATFKKFYEFCQQNKDLACLPKFVDVGGGEHYATFNIQGKEYMQIAMEQLYPIKDGSFQQGMVWFLSDYSTKGTAWPEVKAALSTPGPWQNSDFAPRANQYALKASNLKGRADMTWQLLYTVMILLYRTGRINRFGWDLHTANVMQRKDGTLVIVDPWYSIEEGS